MLRVAFAGTPDFAVPTLEALVHSQHRLVGVLTRPDRPAGRGRELKTSSVKQYAQALAVPLAQPASLTTAPDRAELVSWRPDVLVVVAYGLILPAQVLAIPELGCVNVHASLLPRWRGAAPIQRAILAGDRRSGVTIMQMAPGLDTGPILMQQSIELSGEETSADLHARLARLGSELLIETLDALSGGTVSPVEQSSVGVTYAHKIDKREALIDWQQSSQQIARNIRAFNPWPVAHTLWDGQSVRLWEAHPVEDAPSAGSAGQILGLEHGRLAVQCGQGKLEIARMQLAGRRVVSAREFSGGRVLTGMHFG
jgi:methionyl-tRNA formyltransferase